MTGEHGSRGRRLFRLPISKATLARDIEAEIAFHIESRIADLEAQGLSHPAAEERAMREFGDQRDAERELCQVGRRRLRGERRAALWDAFHQDVRHALRGAWREPGFALAVVLTLALGVGANATMFGITDRLLLRAPAGVAEPESVVRLALEQRNPATGEVTIGAGATSYATYRAWRDEVGGLSAISAYSSGQERSLGHGVEAQSIRVTAATATFFEVLGARPALGRFFDAAEDAPPQGERLAVISHGFWRRHFGGARDAPGRVVDIDGESYVVVGVAPEGFNGLEVERVDVWLPASVLGPIQGGADWHVEHNMFWLRVVARLGPDASPEVVATQATAVLRREHPRAYEIGLDPRVVPAGIVGGGSAIGATEEQRRARRVSVWLLGVSCVVLLVACANVANLMLARSLRRRRETGVRLAMGGGRGRLAARVLTETLVLAVLGAAAGVLLAAWGGRLVRGVLLPDVYWPGALVDGRVLGFSAAVAFAAALLAGLAPALVTAREDVAQLLRTGGGSATYRRSRLRGGLVVAQGALCVLLLVGAGLFVRSLHNAHAVDLGFDARRAVIVEWSSTALQRPAAERIALYDRAHERIVALPGVESAALSVSYPYWFRMGMTIRAPGIDSIARAPDGGPYYTPVSPEYFQAMRMPILRGRGFTAADVDGAERVAILTERMARDIFGAADALGECVLLGGSPDSPCARVVGIANDVRFITVGGEPTQQLFIPLAQVPAMTARTVIVRTATPPSRVIPQIRQAVQSLDATLPVANIRVLHDLVDPQIRPWRLGATLFTAFGALALILAALGLYAVVAYDVAQRSKELGVRLALGARARHIAGTVIGDAARVLALGLALGLLAALALGGRLEAVLFRVDPLDPLVFGAVALVLATAGLAAAALPARRAMKVDPARVLNTE